MGYKVKLKKKKAMQDVGRISRGEASSRTSSQDRMDVCEGSQRNPPPLPEKISERSSRPNGDSSSQSVEEEMKLAPYPILPSGESWVPTEPELPPRPGKLELQSEQPNAEQEEVIEELGSPIDLRELETTAFNLDGGQLKAYGKAALVDMIMCLRGYYDDTRGHFMGEIEKLQGENRRLETSSTEQADSTRRQLEDQARHYNSANAEWMNEQTRLGLVISRLQDDAVAKHQQRLQAEEKLHVQHREAEERLRSEYNEAMKMYNEAQTKFLQADKEKRQIGNVLAKMRKADPHKLDDSYFRTELKNLRYSIRNWCRSQPIPLSQKSGVIGETFRRFGGEKPAPMYEFLQNLTVRYEEYTSSAELFPWLVQAYIWDQLVDYVFDGDLWAGPNRPPNEGDNPDKQVLVAKAFDRLRRQLLPEKGGKKEELEEFHEWRSTTCRILSKKITPDVLDKSVRLLRIACLQNFQSSVSEVIEFDFEEFDMIVRKALELSASMAKQRARWVFQCLDKVDSQKAVKYVSDTMSTPFEIGAFDEKRQERCVEVTLAPGLFKYGSSEGTNYETKIPIMKTEVRTMIYLLKR